MDALTNGWHGHHGRNTDWWLNRVNQLLSEPQTTRTAAVPAEVIEDTEGYQFYFDLPGVKADSIEVRVEEGVLVVDAERSRPEYPKGAELHRDERYYGKFHRAFQLPEKYGQEPVSASYRDGVLHVTVSKPAAAKPVRIKVDHS